MIVTSNFIKLLTYFIARLLEGKFIYFEMHQKVMNLSTFRFDNLYLQLKEFLSPHF